LVRDAARDLLADQLRDELKDADIFEEPNLFTDLLTAALDRVDWQEIAEAFVSEVDVPKSGATAEPESGPEEPSKIVRVLDVAPRFPLGRMVATPGVLAIASAEEMATALSRHERGDWGLVCPSDRAENERALQAGGQLLSVYETQSHIRFWVLTAPDRTVTTVELPSDH